MHTLHQRRKKGTRYWPALVLLGTLFVLGPDATAETDCRVIDGDTLRCGRERIRIQGVDTRERGQPGYEAAKERLRQLTERKNLRIERKARDRYGRTVGKVIVDGEDVGKRMKTEGHGKLRAPKRTRRR